MFRTELLFVLVAVTGCGKQESTTSKPVTCEVAGQMVAKRMGEYADKAKITGAKRAELDTAMAAAITTRCTEDKWDDVPLGCLGALARIKDGEVEVATYRRGIDICTDGAGKENTKKLDTAVGEVVRSVMKK